MELQRALGADRTTDSNSQLPLHFLRSMSVGQDVRHRPPKKSTFNVCVHDMGHGRRLCLCPSASEAYAMMADFDIEGVLAGGISTQMACS